MSEKRQVIGVLGCHRSGTSALTRGLQSLGAVIGDDVLPPLEGNNPTGFWEDRELHNLLQRIQRTGGSDWDQLGYGFATEHRYALTRAKPLLSEYFEGRLSRRAPFAFKNPRATLMLPMLREVLGELDADVSFVVAVRDPLSVAASLESRDGIPTDVGVLLWLKHTVAAVVDSEGCNRVFVRYDEYLENPERELGRMLDTLDVRGLDLAPSELETLREGFLRPDLRHHEFGADELRAHPAMTAPVLRAYEDLVRVASGSGEGGCGQIDQDLWAGLAADVANRRREWLLIDEARRDADDAGTATGPGQSGLASPRRGRLDDEATRLSAALEANNRAMEMALTGIEERVTTARREAELRASEASIENLQLRDEIRELRGRLEELDRVSSRLVIERDAARAKVALGGVPHQTRHEVAELERTIAKLQSSTSWRLTKPLRSVGDAAKRVRRAR